MSPVELDNDSNDAVDIADGGTNATTAAQALANLGGVALANSIDWANPVAINTATALTIGKHHVINDLSSPADFTVTLPAVSGNAGKLISIEIDKDTTKLVTVDGNSTELIDGEQTRVMWAKETAILLCDGSVWTKVAGKSIPMEFSVYLSAAQTGLTSGTFNKINADTETIDYGGVWDAANYKAVIRRSNAWEFVFGAAPYSETSSQHILRTIAALYVGGTSLERIYDIYPYNTFSGNPVWVTGTAKRELSATNEVEFYCYATTSSGTFAIGATTTVAVHRTGCHAKEVLRW